MRLRLAPILVMAPMLSLAQVVSLETLSVTMHEPSRIVTAVELTSSGGAKPTSVQWSFEYDGNQIDRVVVAPGETAKSAGKTITCRSQTGETICIVWGLNRNAIQDGIVAKATFYLNRNTYSGLPISLMDVSVTSAAGERLRNQMSLVPFETKKQFSTARYLRYLRRHRRLLLSSGFLGSAIAFLLGGLFYRILKRTGASIGPEL